MEDGVVFHLGVVVLKVVGVDHRADPELVLIQLHNLVVLHVVDQHRKLKLVTLKVVQLMVDGVIGVIGDHVPSLVGVEHRAEPELALVQLHNLVVLRVAGVQQNH